MTDNLPPLPKGDITYYITDSTMRRMECDAHSDGQMQAYARAAIDAVLAARGAVPAGFEDAYAQALVCSNLGTIKDIARLCYYAAAPQQVAQPSEVVEAAEEHPTNNHLFKVMCERAGIVLGVDRVDVALEKIDRLFAQAKPEQEARTPKQLADDAICDAPGYYNPQEARTPMPKSIAAPEQQEPKCLTCNGHGMIGGPSFYAPDEGGVPCPDCNQPKPVQAPNAQQAEAQPVALTLAALQQAHIERQEEWCPEQKPDLSFRGNELGGECGEAQNVIKKLERERHGWRGSRDTIEHLGEELADVVHCATLCAITAGIDIEKEVIRKFNSTSEKNNLASRLTAAQQTAAQPKAVPLNHAQINAAYGAAKVQFDHIPHPDVVRIVRAVEAAHGIGAPA